MSVPLNDVTCRKGYRHCDYLPPASSSILYNTNHQSKPSQTKKDHQAVGSNSHTKYSDLLRSFPYDLQLRSSHIYCIIIILIHSLLDWIGLDWIGLDWIENRSKKNEKSYSILLLLSFSFHLHRKSLPYITLPSVCPKYTEQSSPYR